MTIRLYTDDELASLRSAPKRVTNPGARWVTKPGHRQRNFQVSGLQDDPARFTVYQRQSEQDEKDFSSLRGKRCFYVCQVLILGCWRRR